MCFLDSVEASVYGCVQAESMRPVSGVALNIILPSAVIRFIYKG